jgi:hypothetical protein
VLFGGLSGLDLYLTWLLVHLSGGDVYEGNPIAGAWLTAYGWTGLIVFKAIDLEVVSGLTFVISVYRPQVGRRLLSFACVAAAAVAVYSSVLLLHALPTGGPLRGLPLPKFSRHKHFIPTRPGPRPAPVRPAIPLEVDDLSRRAEGSVTWAQA